MFDEAVLINGIAMIGVNAGYVYATINFNSTSLTIVQFLLAIFKLLWNEYAVKNLIVMSAFYLGPWCSRLHMNNALFADHAELRDDIPFRTFVLLFNNIVTACFVFFVISPVCFFNMLVNPQQVQTSYQLSSITGYGICSTLGPSEERCSVSNVVTYSTSYTPPFTYSYQCSSTFVQNYAAMYVFMFLIIAFVDPLMQLILKYVYDYTHTMTSKNGVYLHRMIGKLLLPMLKPLPPQQLQQTTQENANNSNTTKQINAINRSNNTIKMFFSKSRFVLHIVTQIAILLTFGVIFPPLAVIILVAIFSYSLFTQVVIGRFLSLAKGQPEYAHIQSTVAKELDGVNELFVKSFPLLFMFTGMFYALFLFDTLGDVQGARKSIWIALVMMCIPIVLFVIGGMCNRWWVTKQQQKSKIEDHKSSIDTNIITMELATRNVLQIEEEVDL